MNHLDPTGRKAFPQHIHFSDNPPGALVCPICGLEYTHVRAARTKMNDSARLDVEVLVGCEADHHFIVVLHQHEGYTFLQSSGAADVIVAGSFPNGDGKWFR